MTKNIAAVASYIDAPAAEGCPKEAVEKILALLAVKSTGDTLSADEYAAVKDALAVIGACETGFSDDQSFQGACKYSYEAEGAGIKVEAGVNMNCKGVMDRFRMEWTMGLDLKKIAGEAAVEEVKWNYTIASFGTLESGEPSILLSRVYDSKFNDGMTIAKFEAGEVLKSTRMDVSSFQQWGFFIYGQAEIITSEGTLFV